MQKHRVVTMAIHQVLSGSYLNSQIRTLVACVMGLVAGGEVGLAGIGRHLPGGAEPKHKIKRVDRFCGNSLIDVKPLCRAMLLALVKRHQSLLVSVDWTKIDNFQVLVFAVTTRYGRSIPVYWEVIDPNEERMKAVEVAAVDHFHALVPLHVKVTILADRGFDGVKFIAAVAKRFPYVIRLAKGNSISEESGSEKFLPVFVSLAESLTVTDVAVDFGEVLFTDTHKFSTRIIGFHARKREDPWFLATCRKEDAHLILQMYARRFDIEHAFKDWKDVHHGWQLGSVRCTQPDRLARLLIVPAVGFLMMILLGLLAESRNQHRSLQVNSVKNKRCLSLWRVGVLRFTTVRRLSGLKLESLLAFLEDLPLQLGVA
jgi:hypothetical protein